MAANKSKLSRFKTTVARFSNTNTDFIKFMNEKFFTASAYKCEGGLGTVSYTHLTLPTNREV